MRMSCNGCRVLRKRCSETCALKSCLQWITTPSGQAHATMFLSRFFGRKDLVALVEAVPAPHRPAVFQSLLYEACGRVVNPVNGVVGLLVTGKWHVCHAAVNVVLMGGMPRPLPAEPGPGCNILAAVYGMHNMATLVNHPYLNLEKILPVQNQESSGMQKRRREATEESEMAGGRNVQRKKLLKLFV